jgi:stage V sporulation protein B
MKESPPTITSSQFEASGITSAAQGASLLTIVSLIVAVLGYIFSVILSWLLPVDQFGTYGVYLAFYSILALFITTAFPWTTAKFLSSEDSLEQRYKIFKSSLVGNILIAVVISIIFYFVYSFSPPRTGDERWLVLLILVILLVNSPLTVYLGALQGLFRFKQLGIIQLLVAVLRLASGAGLVYLGYGVLGALAGYLVAAIIVLVVAVYLLRGFRFWQGRGWGGSRILTFAPAMFFGILGITLLSNLDILGVKFLTEAIVSSELAGYYQSALILARIPVLVTGAMMMAIFPFISKYAESDSRSYSHTSLKYATLLVFPVAIAIALKPVSLITLFFPQSYAAGADALRVVAIGMGLLSLIQVLANTFQALGRPWTPAIALIVVSGVQTGALVGLVPKWGLVGGAAATTIACFLGLCYLLTMYLNVYRPSIKPIQILKLIVALGVPGYLLFSFMPEGRLLIVVSLILVAIIYYILLLLLRLIDERDVEIVGGALPQSNITSAIVAGTKRLTIRLNRVMRL